MHLLPEELLQNIFLSLTAPYRQDGIAEIATLAHVCAVSRTFNRIATPLLYQSLHIDFQYRRTSDDRHNSNHWKVWKRAQENPSPFEQTTTLRCTYQIRDADPNDEVYVQKQRIHEAIINGAFLRIVGDLPNLQYIDVRDFSIAPAIWGSLLYGSFESNGIVKLQEPCLLSNIKRLDIDLNGEVLLGFPAFFSLSRLETLSIRRACMTERDQVTEGPHSVDLDTDTSNIKHLALTAIRIDRASRDGSLCSPAFARIGKACKALESLKIEFDDELYVNVGKYALVATSFHKHLLSGSLEELEIWSKGPITTLDHVRGQRSLFKDYTGRVKLAELRTDLGCLVGVDAVLDWETLPRNIRHLTLRCRSEVWDLKGDTETREGNPLKTVVCDPITWLGDDFRKMFPDLHRITLETGELDQAQLAELFSFLAGKGVRFEYKLYSMQ